MQLTLLPWRRRQVLPVNKFLSDYIVSHLWKQCAARCVTPERNPFTHGMGHAFSLSRTLWFIVKIATRHVHGSKQMRVETAHVHPATCNLARWLTRHGSPTIYRCFTLPQLLYRWRHQSEIFWIPPCISETTPRGCAESTSMQNHTSAGSAAGRFNSASPSLFSVFPACSCSQVSSDQTALEDPSLIFCGFARFTRIVLPNSSESFYN
jgi:hypothetical protein